MAQDQTQQTRQKPRVFISYSRADGEEFATDLRKRLEAENLSLWQDRAQMEGGVSWWKQITDALDAVEFMVLVATPSAIASAVVKKEWRYARQQGVCVYPVQVPGLPLDFAAMLKWMRDSHFYNLDHEWETFVNYLKAPCTVPKVPFMAPDLPEHFVPRPDKFEPLKRQLLDADFDNPVAITTALKGAGGFGKTTLAAALCHDEDIQTAFDEGVLWVTLGENPNIINKLTVLYRALTDENPGFIEIEEGANKLAEKLVDADVLLIIDDVWEPAHLRPFLRGGECVARLVTTRFSNIAVDANADLLEVDEMTADESVQMLLAGIEPPENLTPFKALAERLGEWALMLEVTNGTLRKRMAKGADLDGALAYVNKALDKRGIGGLKTGSNEAAVQVLDTSIEQIDADEQPRLFELAIFAEDTDIPLTSVMALWDMDDFDTEELIDQFDDLSFVHFDAEQQTIRMHDVVREVMLSRLDDPAAVHARLISNYGDLTALPDNYAWRNLAHHLTNANQTTNLRALLLDYRYLYAKLIATDHGALINDCVYFSDDEIVKLIKFAVELSANVLIDSPNHLAHQLVGRLMLHRSIHKPIRDLTNWIMTNVPGLYPAYPDSKYVVLNPAGGSLLRTLEGHNDDVLGALELSDGRILSWSQDNTLRIWDSNGNLLIVMDGHTSFVVNALELTDGKILSYAASIPYHSSDSTLRLWNVDGTQCSVLNDHKGAIQGALQLANGKLLSWSSDGMVCLWDDDGEPLAAIEDNSLFSGFNGILELNDCRLLSWSGKFGNNNKLTLWSNSLSPLLVLEGHTARVRGALELANGCFLSWADSDKFHGVDNSLRLWTADGNLKSVLTGHLAGVNGVLELKSGHILSWSDDNTLRLWDEDGQPLAVLEGHTRSVSGALETADARLLSWSDDNTLRLWDEDGQPLVVMEGHTGWIEGALELSDSRIISYARDTALHIWDGNGQPLDTIKGHTGSIRGALELNNDRLLSWSSDNTLRLWDTAKYAVAPSVAHIDEVNGVLELADKQILSWSRDTTLRLWDSNGQPMALFEGHTKTIKGALELADKRVLSWSYDNTLRLWDEDGQPLAVLEGHTRSIEGVLELADGRLLSWTKLTGYQDDETLRLWDMDGQSLAALENPLSDKEVIAAWRQQHNVDVDESNFRSSRLKHDDSASEFVQKIGDRLYVPETGIFVSDAPYSYNAKPIIMEDKLVIGNKLGWVLFLRVHNGSSDE